MTSILVPDEAAGHLGAILLAFNREIFGGILDDADELARLGQVTSAILVAGTVLEYLEKSPVAGLLLPEQRRQIAGWRQLRNEAAHGSPVALTVPQARQVIEGARRILMAADTPGERGSRRRTQGATASVKGKYSYVPTSSADFIERKRAEIDLEDRG